MASGPGSCEAARLMEQSRKKRKPRSKSLERLGAALRAARETAGLTTRQMGFSSGHVANVEGGHVLPSSSYVDRHVALGADRGQLEGLLEEARRDGRIRKTTANAAGASIPPQGVDEHTRGRDLRIHYTVRSYLAEFDFTEHGAIRRVRSTAAVTANSDKVRYYYTGHGPDERHGQRPPPTISNVTGAELDRINFTPVGSFEAFFRLEPPLMPDDLPRELAYTIEYESSDLADGVIIYLAPPGAQRHVLRMRFCEPALPESIWSFAAPDALMADHPQPDAQLQAAEDGWFVCEFDDLVSGWYYGATWRWPPELT